jgi:hypothetical protein
MRWQWLFTEHVWGTCVDVTPGYLCDGWSVAEVESIKALKCRVRVYKREIQRFLTAHILTNTHAMCGVPASLLLPLCFWCCIWMYLIHFRSV